MDDDNESDDKEKKEEAKDFAMEVPKKKKKVKKEQRFLNFVYKSKFNALLDQLKHARDKDPNGKSCSHYDPTYGPWRDVKLGGPIFSQKKGHDPPQCAHSRGAKSGHCIHKRCHWSIRLDTRPSRSHQNVHQGTPTGVCGVCCH
jgi:hypothetical protein